MKVRILRAIFGRWVFVISPLFLDVVIGALYIAFHKITEYSMIEGFY